VTSVFAASRVLAVGAVLLASGCSLLGSRPPLLETLWVAADIGGAGIVDRTRSTMRLHAGGTVSGDSGCNQYRGLAKIDGKSLLFDELVSTRKACSADVMDQELRFLRALSATRTIAERDGTLQLSDKSRQPLVRFVPADG